MMCRFSIGQYKSKFACFDCRKSFRAWPILTGERYQDKNGHWRNVTIPHKCPDCGQPMADMGVGFKPPRRSDLGQWEKVHRIYQNGVIFQMRCCYGPGERPARLNQVDEFLADRDRRREKSEGEKLLERFKQADK
jgi:hypothetical protein